MKRMEESGETGGCEIVMNPWIQQHYCWLSLIPFKKEGCIYISQCVDYYIWMSKYTRGKQQPQNRKDRYDESLSSPFSLLTSQQSVLEIARSLLHTYRFDAWRRPTVGNRWGGERREWLLLVFTTSSSSLQRTERLLKKKMHLGFFILCTSSRIYSCLAVVGYTEVEGHVNTNKIMSLFVRVHKCIV